MKELPMPLKVAMFQKSYDYIKPRLDALGLDVSVVPFDKAGQFLVDGKAVSRRDLDLDYVWLSTHINADGLRDTAFDYMLECKTIGVLQTFNAGLDHPFYKKLSDKGTRVCNSSAQGVAIAEYVMAQVLSVLHPIELQRRLQGEKKWQATPFREISQSSWLIVGFGPIGQELARRVKAFGANVAVVRRSTEPTPLADQLGTMADFPRLLPTADIVVLACPLNEATRDFADREFFAAMKPGTILVNIARGPLIVEADMLAALYNGKLETAILDVFDQEPLPTTSPLWSHPKVRLTSHTSFAGSGGRGRWDQLFLDNIKRFANGEKLINEVDPHNIV
jgi:phosphoglycerate dehydrogenase-like enzyme